jgi:hypothetical protein
MYVAFASGAQTYMPRVVSNRISFDGERMSRMLVVICTLCLAVPMASAQDPLAAFSSQPRAHVFVLGVFHFQDAGLDSYKPQFPFDIREPQRQRELAEVLDRLAAWGPTRIAVEARPLQQRRLDSLFAIYPASGTDTLRNETYQIGFKLARRLGLAGVHAIDAPARRLDSAMTQQEWDQRQRALTRGAMAATNWDSLYRALYRFDDSVKAVRTLRETLLSQNAPERLDVGHGHYLVGDLLNGAPGDYLGADGFISGWYNRNVRIYSNIVRLARSTDERLLVIIGAGHVPILRHLLLSSPAVRLVEVSDILR